MVPLRLGSPQQFSAVREFLGQADYSEQAVSKRLGLGGLHEYLRRGEKSGPPTPAEVPDALDVLVRIFLAGRSVSRELMRRFIPSAVQESLEALGILCTDPAHPDECYSPVALYPVEGLWIASDRWRNPDGSPIPNVKDFLFPAIHPLTHGFLDLLPQSPCDRLLDLGSGTGIAALAGFQALRTAVLGSGHHGKSDAIWGVQPPPERVEQCHDVAGQPVRTGGRHDV